MSTRSSRFLILTFLYTCQFQAHIWHNPNSGVMTSYVYAPGVLVSEILMARYCPKFTASTGELVTCSKGIEVISLPASSGNFAEIKLKPVKVKRKKRGKPAVAKASDFAKATTDKKAGKTVPAPVPVPGDPTKTRPKKEPFMVRALLAPFRGIWHVLSFIGSRTFLGCTFGDKPKANESVSMYSVDPRKVNLAQEEDLAILNTLYASHLNAVQEQFQDHEHGVVLYGTSRGSAAVFNYAALYQPEEVRAVICEALFDSVDHVQKATNSGLIRFKINLLRKVSSFKDDGILPINLVDVMPRDIPLLLVTSLEDQTVPFECTLNIYNQLRTRGHEKVHILILEKSSHVNYPCGNKKDRDRYEAVVHAFYRHYGLPHIQELAAKGEQFFLLMTQPDAPTTDTGFISDDTIIHQPLMVPHQNQVQDHRQPQPHLLQAEPVAVAV